MAVQNERIRVYPWEFPVRFTHWINAVAIFLFIVTGLYIGRPYLQASGHEQFLMGYVRATHFITGYVLFCTLLIRLYWAFAGNKYASWRVWFPFYGQRAKDLIGVAKFYSFLNNRPPYAVGHTALAGLAYFFVFFMLGYEVVSGFALLSQSSSGAFPAIVGGWLLGIMDIQTIRVYHHMVTYLLIAFFFVHLYISWWMDGVERNGLMGSIFGGNKFVTGKEWE